MSARHRAAGFFVLRTPLLSFDELLGWAADLAAPGVAPGDGERLGLALVADRARLGERLRAIAGRPAVREALFLASPDLDERIAIWLRNPESDAGGKVERAVVRYLARMAARPTPFGLFAGGSLGKLGETTRLARAARGESRRHSRIDLDLLVAIGDAFGRDPSRRSQLVHRPNATLHAAGGRMRYAATRIDPQDRTRRTHHLVSLAITPRLSTAIERARDGATLSSLIEAITREHAIPRAEAADFVEALAGAELLVHDLAPFLTGDDPLSDLVARLRFAGVDAVADTLAEAGAALVALDAHGLGNPPDAYRAIAARLDALQRKANLPRLFHADLVRIAPGGELGRGYIDEVLDGARTLRTLLRADEALYGALARGLEGSPAPAANFRFARVDLYPAAPSATLGPRCVDEVLCGVELLARLAVPDHRLAAFIDAFTARYGEGEVPLLEALDEEAGIPFGRPAGGVAEGEPLAGGLDLDEREPEPRFGAREQRLLEIIDRARAATAIAVELTPGDLERMSPPGARPLPDAFSALAAIAAASEAAVNAGAFRVLVSAVYGPPGTLLFARFAGGDAALKSAITEHLREEEAAQPGAIFASIVHLPEGMSANVLGSPRLRDHEIPLLGRSGAPAASQIAPTDLLLSAPGGRLRLRSRSRDREVIPRLDTAHDFRGGENLAGYRFLCALQHRDTHGWLSFSWGALDRAPFLPRLTVGRVVLSRARWRLDGVVLKALGRASGAARFTALGRLRRELRIPRFVHLSQLESELPIDFDNLLSTDSFVHLVKGQTEALLIEPFPPPDELCVTGPEGRYVHELVVPFVRRAQVIAPDRASPPTVARSATPAAVAPGIAPPSDFRFRFSPGTPWLHLDLYTGPALADEVLRKVVRPAIDRARAAGAADAWFFIRWADPDFHLRLRLHGDPLRLLGETLPDLVATAAPWLDDGRIAGIQLGSYAREVERYGGPQCIALAERIFCADSEAVLGLIEQLAGHAGAEARWRLALIGADQLLDALGLSLDEKRLVVQAARAELAAVLHAGSPDAGARFDRELAARHRRQRVEIAALLDGGGAGTALAPGLPLLAMRAAAVRSIAEEMRALERGGQLSRPIAIQAGSYLHMFANRWFSSDGIPQEIAIADLLLRRYQSLSARARKR